VVEDNEVNQMVAEGMVERLGYEVDVVSNGLEAVAAVAACRYSAVLMDCHMPVMDGFSATAQIRELDVAGDRTPVIAMTAGVTVEERRRCLASGMDAFVSKPVELDALRETLTAWARPPGPAT
jgi:two-component system sensor histidine kinase/response regulator